MNKGPYLFCFTPLEIDRYLPLIRIPMDFLNSLDSPSSEWYELLEEGKAS